MGVALRARRVGYGFDAGLGMQVGVDQAVLDVAGGLLHHVARLVVLGVGRLVAVAGQALAAVVFDLVGVADLAVLAVAGHGHSFCSRERRVLACMVAARRRCRRAIGRACGLQQCLLSRCIFYMKSVTIPTS